MKNNEYLTAIKKFSIIHCCEVSEVDVCVRSLLEAGYRFSNPDFNYRDLLINNSTVYVTVNDDTKHIIIKTRVIEVCSC